MWRRALLFPRTIGGGGTSLPGTPEGGGMPHWADVMTNFMCRLDWATGCPDIQCKVILGVSG